MSMNYGVVKPSFWTGATGRALRQDVDAQVVALYLMTSPHANIIGVFRCPIDYIKIETGRTIEGASKGLTKLCELGFCSFDPETETVWVREMARFQIGDALKGGDKRIKHVIRFFDEIENPRFKRAFFEKYGAAYQLPEPPKAPDDESPIEGASKPIQSPIEATVTVTVTSTDTVTPHPSDEDASPIEGASKALRNIKPISKRKASPQKSSVPADLRLQGLRDYFTEQADRLGVTDGANEFDRFIDHHRAKGSTFADWEAASRTWLRNSVKFAQTSPALRSGSHPQQFQERVTNGFATILMDRKRQEQQHADGPIIDVTPNQPGGSSGTDRRKELTGR
ncbi:hypothetical protein [Nitrobacter hamburgensis]|nr:hypothetical protein [Nitrobacter hamburgensis]